MYISSIKDIFIQPFFIQIYKTKAVLKYTCEGVELFRATKKGFKKLILLFDHSLR